MTSPFASRPLQALQRYYGLVRQQEKVQMPKAVVFAEYGGPEVLTYSEVEMPEPGAGQVRLAVRAAGVNPVEWKIRRGDLAGGAPLHDVRQLGTDVAGVVDAVGNGVTAFAIGDEVFGRANNDAYAEYALADVNSLAQRPAQLEWDVAASLAISAETAYRTLGLLGVTGSDGLGKTVLIHAASGGVGTIAVQLAILRGARVLGTASESNQNYLRSLGAEPIPYGEGWLDRVRRLAPRGVDAVLDLGGRGVLEGSIDLTENPSNVITVADRKADQLGVRYSRGLESRADMQDVFREVLPLIVGGRLTITIAARFGLGQAAEAHRLSEHGHPGGRIVLIVKGH